MTTVPPPLPSTAVPSGAATPAGVEAVPVTPPSPELAAKLAALRQLQAVVKALDAQTGAAVLATPAGEIAVKLPVPVQPGMQLLLQVAPPPKTAGALPALRLVAIEGQPPAQFLRLAGAAGGGRAPPLTTTPLHEAATSVVPSGPSAVISATIVRAAPQLPGQPMPPLPGTDVPVRILAVTPAPPAGAEAAAPPGASAAKPQSGPAPISSTGPQSAGAQPVPGQPAAAPTPVPPQSGGAPAPASSLPTAAPTGAVQTNSAADGTGRGAMPVVAASPASSGSAGAATESAARIIGTVAPNSHSGQPLLQTSLGLVTLRGAPPLAVGAQVVLEIAGAPRLPAALPLGGSSSPALGAPAFSGLAGGLEALRQIDPTVAARLQAALPQMGPRLAVGMVIFAAALRADAAAAQLIEAAVQSLDRAGRRETARRLAQDMGDAMPQSRATPSGEWRAASMPMLLHGGTIEPIRLWLRRPEWDDDDPEGRNREGRGGGQRFVVDVDFSHFGRFQMDSLIQRQARRYDVAIRTDRPLPDEVRQEIAAIFRRCCDALGLAGQSVFKSGEPFFEPAAEISCAAGQQGILA